jgi:hypothetical protein
MKIDRRRLKSAFGSVVLLVASCALVAAAVTDREVITVALNAGDTYIIKNLGTDSTPAIHVIDNPNALVVRSGAPWAAGLARGRQR